LIVLIITQLVFGPVNCVCIRASSLGFLFTFNPTRAHAHTHTHTHTPPPHILLIYIYLRVLFLYITLPPDDFNQSPYGHRESRAVIHNLLHCSKHKMYP